MSIQDFQMSYEWSPITLIGGIAQNMNGGALPILYLLQPGAFPNGILSGGNNINPDDIFAHFQPVPGGKLIDNEIAEFPLANQIVAANAVIVQPLRISLVMKAPAQGEGGYASKLSTITALRTALASHTTSGGTYNVSTPSYIYTNCLLLDLVDVSGTQTAQVQTEWQWNFEQPLLTIAQAQQAQNNLMSKMSSGTQVSGTDGAVNWTGPDNTVNQPQSLAMPSYVPSGSGTNSSAVGASSGLV
jgi:hypothetical protein